MDYGIKVTEMDQAKSHSKVGILIYISLRAVFVGQFVNGNKQGKGKMSYPSGNYYDGEFYLDKKAGQGVMFWLNSNEKYFGEWKDN